MILRIPTVAIEWIYEGAVPGDASIWTGTIYKDMLSAGSLEQLQKFEGHIDLIGEDQQIYSFFAVRRKNEEILYYKSYSSNPLFTQNTVIYIKDKKPIPKNEEEAFDDGVLYEKVYY